MLMIMNICRARENPSSSGYQPWHLWRQWYWEACWFISPMLRNMEFKWWVKNTTVNWVQSSQVRDHQLGQVRAYIYIFTLKDHQLKFLQTLPVHLPCTDRSVVFTLLLLSSMSWADQAPTNNKWDCLVIGWGPQDILCLVFPTAE